MSKEFRKFEVKTFNTRGNDLTPIEFKDLIPFEVKRLYYFQNLKSGMQTGEHCHKKEEEVFLVIKGSITAMIDKGNGKEDIKLAGPNDAIFVPAYVWHGFKEASADCVVLAISSTNFNPDRSDYIENYEEFVKVRGEIK